MAGIRYIADLADVGAFQHIEQLVRPANLIFHGLTAFLVGHVTLLPRRILSRLRRRDRVSALEPAIEVDVFAAPGTERPKALGRGLAADRAGFGRVRLFRHAVQIRGSEALWKLAILSSRPSEARAGIQ
jgi:hypothetical protein